MIMELEFSLKSMRNSVQDGIAELFKGILGLKVGRYERERLSVGVRCLDELVIEAEVVESQEEWDALFEVQAACAKRAPNGQADHHASKCDCYREKVDLQQQGNNCSGRSDSRKMKISVRHMFWQRQQLKAETSLAALFESRSALPLPEVLCDRVTSFLTPSGPLPLGADNYGPAADPFYVQLFEDSELWLTVMEHVQLGFKESVYDSRCQALTPSQIICAVLQALSSLKSPLIMEKVFYTRLLLEVLRKKNVHAPCAELILSGCPFGSDKQLLMELIRIETEVYTGLFLASAPFNRERCPASVRQFLEDSDVLCLTVSRAPYLLSSWAIPKKCLSLSVCSSALRGPLPANICGIDADRHARKCRNKLLQVVPLEVRKNPQFKQEFVYGPREERRKRKRETKKTMAAIIAYERIEKWETAIERADDFEQNAREKREKAIASCEKRLRNGETNAKDVTQDEGAVVAALKDAFGEDLQYTATRIRENHEISKCGVVQREALKDIYGTEECSEEEEERSEEEEECSEDEKECSEEEEDFQSCYEEKICVSLDSDGEEIRAGEKNSNGDIGLFESCIQNRYLCGEADNDVGKCQFDRSFRWDFSLSGKAAMNLLVGRYMGHEYPLSNDAKKILDRVGYEDRGDRWFVPSESDSEELVKSARNGTQARNASMCKFARNAGRSEHGDPLYCNELSEPLASRRSRLLVVPGSASSYREFGITNGKVIANGKYFSQKTQLVRPSSIFA